MWHIRENLFIQFSVVSLLVMVVVAATITVLLSNVTRSYAIDAFVDDSINHTSVHFFNAITPADLEAPMTGERYDSFNEFVIHSLISEETAGVKVWAKDGTIVYSNNPALMGLKFPNDQTVIKALRGITTADVPSPEELEEEGEVFPAPVMEVYTPIVFPGSTAPAGVLEIYQYYQGTQQLIDDQRRVVYMSVISGFVILYGALVSGVWRGWKTITRHQQEREKAEQNFRNSLDNSPLGIRIVSEGGETLYANRAILDFYGYESIEELRSIPVRERYTLESYAEHQVRMEERQHGEPEELDYEISIVRKDGAIRHLQVFRKEVIWNGQKQYQILYDDITERKKAEESLRESEERFRRLAEELQRQNDQKTEFLHHVAHELKTPLTAIISTSELVTADDISKIPLEQREQLLNNINRSAWMMDTTVSELLDLASIQIGRVELILEPLDLREIVNTITSQISPLFKDRRQSVAIEISANLPPVTGDRKRVTEVILNLLSNANKFSSAGGHVAILGREQNDVVRVEVKDTAPIIDETERVRIFEAYYRGGSAEDQQRLPGLGLGLAIAKSLVTLQGGEIGVVSEEGRGNTFYFTLPIWRDEGKEE